MTEDRFAGLIRSALSGRRPPPSRAWTERLASAAQRPVRPRLFTPAALAVAVAAGVLLVIATRPAPDEDAGVPAGLAAVGDNGGGSPLGAAAPVAAAAPPEAATAPVAVAAPAAAAVAAPAAAAAPVAAAPAAPVAAAGPAATAAPATPAVPATPATRAKLDLREPLAAYQAVLDGASPVALSPAQADRLRTLAGELARQRAYLAERKRDAEAELARALAAAGPDDSRVLAAYDRIAAQDAALGRAALVARLGARGALDPDQRAVVEGGRARSASGQARLTVRSPITGAVSIDGTWIGETPVTATVTPGRHELRLDVPGRAAVTRSLEVGASSQVVLELEPPQHVSPSQRPRAAPGGTGQLTLTTRPPTTIALDGKTVGQTPIQLTLSVGPHEVTMTDRDGRTRKTMTLDVTAGQQSNLSFSFD